VTRWGIRSFGTRYLRLARTGMRNWPMPNVAQVVARTFTENLVFGHGEEGEEGEKGGHA
jgi:hypothetical protein